MGQGPTDPLEQYFDKGLWGYDGTQWRKLALLWGYTAIWDENLGGTATGAAYDVYTADIPAGEIWVLQAISARDTTRATSGLLMYISRASGGIVCLTYEETALQSVPILSVGIFTLRAGDRANIHIGGTQAGDNIQAGVVGYKMAVT